ncbi:MAG: 4-hydroxy-tetrahydrodipicolinate reductase [Dehalococcoidia bacterium]|jgi:4-hydroxy-tetrahydrodipicolinate reductase
MKPIKVAVNGALGKMGQTLIAALYREPGMQPVGATDIKATQDHLTLPDGSGRIPLSKKLEPMLDSCQPEVVIDFSNAEAVMPLVKLAAEKGVNLVIGTTGIGAGDIKKIDALANDRGIGIVIAPNFTLSAVLMIHLARIASKYFDYAEIVELHHERKLDAPSGTALLTAQAMAEARGKPFNTPPAGEKAASRGKQLEGISLHSVRLPGLLAHQEILFGGEGQTLSIRHDTSGRDCYMPGVMLAVKEVMQRKGLTYGLDILLGLEK